MAPSEKAFELRTQSLHPKPYSRMLPDRPSSLLKDSPGVVLVILLMEDILHRPKFPKFGEEHLGGALGGATFFFIHPKP